MTTLTRGLSLSCHPCSHLDGLQGLKVVKSTVKGLQILKCIPIPPLPEAPWWGMEGGRERGWKGKEHGMHAPGDCVVKRSKVCIPDFLHLCPPNLAFQVPENALDLYHSCIGCCCVAGLCCVVLPSASGEPTTGENQVASCYVAVKQYVIPLVMFEVGKLHPSTLESPWKAWGEFDPWSPASLCEAVRYTCPDN